MDALVGHTGFVGGNLARQHWFAACFNSATIEGIAGRRFTVLVCSGMPAAKWIANRDPAGDRATLDRLTGCLRQSEAETAVVVSTVDVYLDPVGVDEDTPIDPDRQHHYGRHRLMLEAFARGHFPRVLAVRLPALFGDGLKKNALYDLLHDNQTEKIHSDGRFQFYPLDRLWADVQLALAASLTTVNLATEPVSMREVAAAAFDREFANDPGTPPPRYDVRTRHAAVFGGRGGYVLDRAAVLAELRAFVGRERRRAA
jgi:nucleoside-diphosphate-sugar epimerase